MGDAKVDDLNVAILGNHDVARLDIAMHDAALVCIAQALANLDDETDFFQQS